MLAQAQGNVVVPNAAPARGQDIPERLIIRLARDHVTIRLNAHIIEGSRASLNAELKLHRIEITILRGRVPYQALIVPGCNLPGELQKWRKLLLRQSCPNIQSPPGIDQCIQAYRWNTQSRQKFEGIG